MIDVNNLNGLICCTMKLLFYLFVEINPIHHSRWIEPNNFWQLSWLRLHDKSWSVILYLFLVHGFDKLPETTRTSDTSMFKDIIGLCKFGKEWNIINHDFTKNILREITKNGMHKLRCPLWVNTCAFTIPSSMKT